MDDLHVIYQPRIQASMLLPFASTPFETTERLRLLIQMMLVPFRGDLPQHSHAFDFPARRDGQSSKHYRSCVVHDGNVKGPWLDSVGFEQHCDPVVHHPEGLSFAETQQTDGVCGRCCCHTRRCFAWRYLLLKGGPPRSFCHGLDGLTSWLDLHWQRLLKETWVDEAVCVHGVPRTCHEQQCFDGDLVFVQVVVTKGKHIRGQLRAIVRLPVAVFILDCHQLTCTQGDKTVDTAVCPQANVTSVFPGSAPELPHFLPLEDEASPPFVNSQNLVNRLQHVDGWRHFLKRLLRLNKGRLWW